MTAYPPKDGKPRRASDVIEEVYDTPQEALEALETLAESIPIYPNGWWATISRVNTVPVPKQCGRYGFDRNGKMIVKPHKTGRK